MTAWPAEQLAAHDGVGILAVVWCYCLRWRRPWSVPSSASWPDTRSGGAGSAGCRHRSRQGRAGAGTPTLCGATRMPLRRYLLWSVVSSAVWAPAFVLIGHVIGPAGPG
ncbi:hypothetical protein ABZY05_08555 [Streptomyces canus]|uniref:DedA family protein n=1 Tax=Streptomyces canus TaxID=58343 RepID=UPI0033A37031